MSHTIIVFHHSGSCHVHGSLLRGVLGYFFTPPLPPPVLTLLVTFCLWFKDSHSVSHPVILSNDLPRHFSRLTLCHSMDYSLPNSSLHGISQIRILKRVTMPSSRGFSQPRDWTHVSCISRIARNSLLLGHWGSPIPWLGTYWKATIVKFYPQKIQLELRSGC